MPISPIRRHFAFSALFAGSTLLFAAVLLAAVPKPSSQTKPNSEAPRQVADALDSIIQPRFQDLTAGNFGMSRISPAVRGHMAIGYLGYFRTQTPAEAALLAQADAARRPYVIAFLHCVPLPPAPNQDFPHSVTAPISFTTQLSTIIVKGTSNGYPLGYLNVTEPLLRNAAVKALPIAEKGKPAQADAGDWTLFLRPVLASQQACLSCHTTAKRGDTLGVMVYAVSKTRTKN